MENITVESDSQRIRHEINNVLAGIVGHTQLLKMRGEMDEKSRERVQKIEDLANRIRDLTQHLKRLDESEA